MAAVLAVVLCDSGRLSCPHSGLLDGRFFCRGSQSHTYACVTMYSIQLQVRRRGDDRAKRRPLGADLDLI